MSVQLARWVIGVLLVVGGPGQARAQCPPEGWDAASLAALKAAGFQIEANEARQALALALLPCLGNADPVLRDGVAFEAYSTWLRGNALEPSTRTGLLERLQPLLAKDAGDEAGFLQPFAALTLSEVARSDRKGPWMSAVQRDALVGAATGYVQGVRDYRGFDSAEGWRHGVAHGADLLMQLALNEQLDKAQLDRILAAVASQVAPAGEHFYIYGEPERLVRPVVFAAMHGQHTQADWDRWMATVIDPAPLPAWDQSHLSQAGLAKRHNTRQFLLGLQTQVRDSKDAKLGPMLPALEKALQTVR